MAPVFVLLAFLVIRNSLLARILDFSSVLLACLGAIICLAVLDVFGIARVGVGRARLVEKCAWVVDHSREERRST